MRLLLVDDHSILRSGLTLLLDSQPGLEVVGQAADGDEAVQKARELKPDLVLMDISMPGIGGIEATRRIVAELPGIQVLVLTMHDDAGYLRQVMAAGASGYVLKQAADAELLTAIRSLERGQEYVYPTLAGRVMKAEAASQFNAPEHADESGDPPTPVSGAMALSQRETEVLQYVALGHTDQEIADRLVVSIKTVSTYKGRVMAKLGLRTRSELVRYALRHGLIRL